MSGALVSLVGKKVLAESARNHFGTEDPYFEEVPASRLNRAFGKKKQKRAKAIPPGLSENDQKILTKVKRRAYRLDYCLFNLCGIRFGWGSVIALIPFAGDVADTALAMMVVKSCEGIDGGLPSRIRMMMLVNVIIDFLIGLVPFVGDVADAIYKCNTRNAIALEKHLREKGAKSIAKRQRRQGDEVDPSLPDEWDRHHANSSDDPPSYDQAQGADVSRPAPARQQSRGQPRRGWFGGSTHREEDVETGIADNSRKTRQ